MAGLILGLFCAIGGIVILIDWIIESARWPVNLIGTRSAIGTVPGIVLLATGIFIIWLTRFGRDKEEIDQRIHALNGYIWNIHTEAQNLQEVLSGIGKKCEITDEKFRNLEIKAAIKEADELFKNNKTQIEASLEKIKELMEEAPKIHGQYGDKATIIKNSWEKYK